MSLLTRIRDRNPDAVRPGHAAVRREGLQDGQLTAQLLPLLIGQLAPELIEHLLRSHRVAEALQRVEGGWGRWNGSARSGPMAADLGIPLQGCGPFHQILGGEKGV